MYDNIDREIMKYIQGDLAIVSRPYKAIAERLDITEEEVVQRISALQEQGIIRRMGAILRHAQAGYKVNAMVAWNVPPANADECGLLMASHQAVSHCYFRKVPEQFGYPLFTMIHASNDEELQNHVRDLENKTGIKDYQILKSTRELKKTSMVFFNS